MLAAVATMMAAAGLLAAWKSLPGLLAGRLLTGVAVGLASGTAITYLIELRVRKDPNPSAAVRARNIGTSVNVGALGVGPLVAGCLAQWVRQAADRVLPPHRRARGGRAHRPGSRARNCRAGSTGGDNAAGDRLVTRRQDSGSRGSGDPRSLLSERAFRRSLRALPRRHVPPPLPRAGGRNRCSWCSQPG